MKVFLMLLFLLSYFSMQAQNEDYYGPVTISFHGFICNRPTNDDALGMDGVSDEVSVEFWNWTTVASNRANFNGISRIYGEDFLLPNRIKAGTATVNGGIKAGDSYFREGVYGDDDPNILSKYSIVTTFCSQNTLIAILPAIFERDNGVLGTTPIQDFGVVTNNAFNDMAIRQKIWDFRDSYIYNDSNPYDFILAGRYIGLDTKYAGMFLANKNKLATRPIGLFANWDYSSQLLVLTPKIIKIISDKDYGYGKGILPVMYNEETMGNTEGHGSYIVLLRFVSNIKDRNAETTNLKSVSVKVNNLTVGEEYKFKLHAGAKWDSIIIRSPNAAISFQTKIASGQQYHVTQISGPKTCQLVDYIGTITDKDVTVTATCVTPEMSIAMINVTGIEPGESFSFSDNTGQTFTYPFSTEGFLGGIPQGSFYKITQKSGPRSCKLTNNEGTMPGGTLIIQADCSRQSIPPPRPSQVYDLVSRSTDNKTLNSYYETSGPAIGGKDEDEGRYVVFVSSGKGMDGSTGKFRQIFWRDRSTGITKLISKASDGQEANGDNFAPSISQDGKTVAFESYATNLSNNDANGVRDVYAWNEHTNTIILISRTPSGATGNGESYEPVVAGNGNIIAFTSYASDLVSLGPVFTTPNVYVSDESFTTFITKDFETGNAAGGFAPSISEDGNSIAFCANTNRLVRNDNNNLWDIFLWQRNMAELKRISLTEMNAERNQGTESSSRIVWPSISGDGNFIAYATTSSNIVSNDANNAQDIFLFDIRNDQVKRVSHPVSSEDSDGDSPINQGERVGISYDGQWICYNTNAANLGVPKGNIVLQNTVSGKLIPVTNTDGVSTARPVLSRNGNYVIAGCSEKYDKRFSSSGIFAFYTGQ
jgi:hypothetical protein